MVPGPWSFWRTACKNIIHSIYQFNNNIPTTLVGCLKRLSVSRRWQLLPFSIFSWALSIVSIFLPLYLPSKLQPSVQPACPLSHRFAPILWSVYTILSLSGNRRWGRYSATEAETVSSHTHLFPFLQVAARWRGESALRSTMLMSAPWTTRLLIIARSPV